MTKLDKPLKRELLIDARAYVLTIEPSGFKLVLKGHRNGLEFAWRDLVSGDAALTTALNASLTARIAPPVPPSPSSPAPSRKSKSRAKR